MSLPTAARKRVLIAEDDPVSRRLLELFLLKWEFAVSIAIAGSAARQMLERLDAPRLADAALDRAKERGRKRAERARPEALVVRATDFPDTAEQKITTG